MCFFFNDTATTEIYTLSLHDALPICVTEAGHRVLGEHRLALGVRAAAVRLDGDLRAGGGRRDERRGRDDARAEEPLQDRKSTRLNSSHANISYAVFCLKKNKIQHNNR